jgi:hypothetical protein
MIWNSAYDLKLCIWFETPLLEIKRGAVEYPHEIEGQDTCILCGCCHSHRFRLDSSQQVDWNLNIIDGERKEVWMPTVGGGDREGSVSWRWCHYGKVLAWICLDQLPTYDTFPSNVNINFKLNKKLSTSHPTNPKLPNPQRCKPWCPSSVVNKRE